VKITQRNRKEFEKSMEEDGVQKVKINIFNLRRVIDNTVKIMVNNLFIRDVGKYMARALFLIMVRNVMVVIM